MTLELLQPQRIISVWQESVSPSEASVRLLETALYYSCNPLHRKQSQRALWMPLNHLNRCCYYRNEVLLLAVFALSCCSLKACRSAITKPGWKHSRVSCRVLLPHLASWASCESNTAIKIKLSLMKKPKADSYCRIALDTYFQGFLPFICATLQVN